MKTINDYVDAYARSKSLTSDYSIAKNLGLTRQAVSKYRHDRAFPDTGTAWLMADAIGCDPLEIITAAEVARAKRAHDATRTQLWESRLRQMGAAMLLIVVGFLGSATPVQAATLGAESPTLYIMLNLGF